HVAFDDKYDFTRHDQRFEVKTSSTRLRVHHFSRDQLMPPAGTRLLVSSLFVERAGGGVSLAEMIDQVLARVNHDPHLALKVEHVVTGLLGDTWRNSMNERFDFEL